MSYQREFFAEDIVSEISKMVQKEMTTAYVTMNMQRHFPFYFLPNTHHFIPLQSVVPSLQLKQFTHNKLI